MLNICGGSQLQRSYIPSQKHYRFIYQIWEKHSNKNILQQLIELGKQQRVHDEELVVDALQQHPVKGHLRVFVEKRKGFSVEEYIGHGEHTDVAVLFLDGRVFDNSLPGVLKPQAVVVLFNDGLIQIACLTWFVTQQIWIVLDFFW